MKTAPPWSRFVKRCHLVEGSTIHVLFAKKRMS